MCTSARHPIDLHVALFYGSKGWVRGYLLGGRAPLPARARCGAARVGGCGLSNYELMLSVSEK